MFDGALFYAFSLCVSALESDICISIEGGYILS